MILLWFLLVVPAFAQSSVPSISQGDVAFKERAHTDRALEALEDYRAAVKRSARKDSESLWRLAMATYFVGLRLTPESKADEKEKLFAEGRDAGKESIELNSTCAACQFWTAVNMALYGQTVGVFKMLFSLSEIQDHLKKAAQMDPGYCYGGAFRIQGVILQKLPGILGGSNQGAKENFQKSIEVAPDEPLNYLFLATLLKKDLDRPTEAIEVAKKGLSVPAPGPDRLESLEALESLKEFVH